MQQEIITEDIIMEKIKKVVRRMVPAMMLAFFMSLFMPVARVNAAETERIASTRDGYVNIVYSEGSSTGVTDVDSALTNLKTLIVGIVRVFGGIAALVGVVICVLGFTSHNREQQWAGVIVAIAGIIVVFAPEIVNAITGKQLF